MALEGKFSFLLNIGRQTKRNAHHPSITWVKRVWENTDCAHSLIFFMRSFTFSYCSELQIMEHIIQTSKGDLMALWKQNVQDWLRVRAALTPQLGH